MANNLVKVGPIFRGANGGLSDDLFTGVQNSFYESDGIEIRENSKAIYPCSMPGIINSSTSHALTGQTTYRPVAVIYRDTGNFYYYYIFCGLNIHRIDAYPSEGEATEVIATFPSAEKQILDAESFNGYIFITTEKHLFYISDAAATSASNRASMASSTSASDTLYGRITLNSCSDHPLYASDILLAVGNGNKLSKINAATMQTLQDGFELQNEYKITHLEEMGGYIRVIASDGMYGNEILLWDKVNKSATEIIPLIGYRILQSCIYEGYHYILSDKGLGLMNGYQYYLLKKVESSISSYAKNGMCVYDDKLYLTTSDGLYVYGAKNKNYNEVLGCVCKHERLGTVMNINNNLITTAIAGNTGRGERFATAMMAKGFIDGKTGELTTMAYFGTSLSEIKRAEYVKVGYNIQRPEYGSGIDYAEGDIKIFYRTEADINRIEDIEENEGRHELTREGGLKHKDPTQAPFSEEIKLNCRFQWIQFKFVLTNSREGIGNNVNSYLYSVDLFYNTMY